MLAVPGLQWAGRQWRGQLTADDPRVSPLYGSLQGLPSVAVFTGTADLLHTDALRLREKAEAAGHSMTYHERAGLFHVWVGAPIPEAKEALDAAARFLASASN
jgi:monoterpene epsilon-lactone hydrolase